MSSQFQAPPEVFVSYSHVDAEYKEHLVKQLDVLAEQKIISQWHDGLLSAGERWNDEIVKHLRASRVILLLISVDSLTSVYINDVELKEASKRYQAGEVTVIPILVRTVHGWKKKPFGDLKLGELQTLPSKGKFIKGGGDLDEAFADVAAGIQRAVEKLKPITTTHISPPSSIPTSHQTDYVKRHDEQGRDMLERLRELLAPQKKGPVALWGKGGTGKTRIASEAASALTAEFGQRVVWASAEKRADFKFSTLLDEIAAQLGAPELLKLAQEPKEEAVCELLALSPSLLVLDNFETVATDERARCINFLAERANCPSLVTSRLKVPPPARNIPLKGMSNKEAQEFLDQLVEQMQDSGIFTRQVRSRIIKTGESNPYIMLWMMAQIDEAQTPKKVLDELEQGKAPVAERVFDRSFNLDVVGDDGRAVLLALSLFVPDASREALAVVAGFDVDLARVDEAGKNLRMLWLIGVSKGNERMAVEGLTRSLASARLAKDERLDELRRQFVRYFLDIVEEHDSESVEDYDFLEAEKDNLIRAIDVAFSLKEWKSVQSIAAVVASPYDSMLSVRGFWNEALACTERGLEAAKTGTDEWAVALFLGNLASIRQRRGEYSEARKAHCEVLACFRKLGSDENVSVALHQLGILAHDQGDLEEARQLYEDSLDISRRLNRHGGIARTLQQLGKLAMDQGDIEAAKRLYTESLESKRSSGDGTISITLSALGALATRQGDLQEARRLHNQSLEIATGLRDIHEVAVAWINLGVVEEMEGNLVEAARLYQEAFSVLEKLGSPAAKTAQQNLEALEGKQT